MFVSGNLFGLLAALLPLLIGVLMFSRKLAWCGRLPGGIRHEGRRTRVYAPPGSMLSLSPVLSLSMYLLSAIFQAA